MMKKLLDFFDETSKFIFASTAVVMLLAHGFCFANVMFTHDSVGFYYTDGLVKVAAGRWLYPFLVHRRFFATPWLLGAISTLYLTLAVVLVAKLFDLNKIQGLCVGIIFSTNITVTALFCTYIYDADADCLALLLACFAVFSFKKFPKYLNFIIPVFSLTLCLALYQAYICVAIGLFLILLIYESGNCNTWKDVFSVFLCGVRELATLLFAGVLYIPLMSAAGKHYNVELSKDYNGPTQLKSLSLRDIFNVIPKTYRYFKDSFFKVTGYNTVWMARISWITVIMLIVTVVVFILVHRKFLGSLIIVVPCLLMMPLALNAIYLVSFGVIHQLMTFAFCIAYLLPLIIIADCKDEQADQQSIDSCIRFLKKGVGTVSVLLIFFIGFHNAVYSNGAYVYKKLVYDNTALHAQTIWKDINSIEGYHEGETKVVFMGWFSYSKAAYRGPVENRYYDVMIGAYRSAMTYDDTVNDYYYSILGREMNIDQNDPEIQQNDEFINMPPYPADGYCKMIGDQVVVKLND